VLLARLLVVSLLPGCFLLDEDDAAPCDVDATTAIEIVAADGNSVVRPLATGGDLSLLVAPQGGFITLIGPRIAVTSDRCQVQVSAALRDPATNVVVGLEQRPITLERVGAWAQPPSPASISDLANVALCSSPQPVVDQTFEVEVDVLDEDGQKIISATSTAVPRCAASDSYCTTSCAGYL